jgi:multisubunit Na+/H+ antiporter MnhE subunit
MDASDANPAHVPNRFDDATPLGEAESLVPAVVAGTVAALIGGLLWAAVVWLTGYEIGYAAVGLGALVGFAMSRSTRRRDTTVAALAAVLAFAGLATARLVIAEVVAPASSVAEVRDDPELMVEAALLDLEFNGGFPAGLQAEYDALQPGDAIPDAMYDRMRQAAEAHAASMTEVERSEAAAQFIGLFLGTMDMTSRVTAQLTLFDLLWLFLALSTAWKMMSVSGAARPVDEEAPAPADPA